jgi:hypothetical protein
MPVRGFRGSCRMLRLRRLRDGPGGGSIDRRVGPTMSGLGLLGGVATPRTIRLEVRAVKPKTTTSCDWSSRPTTTCCVFSIRAVSTLNGRSSTLARRFSTSRGGAVHGRGAGCPPGFHRDRPERAFSMGAGGRHVLRGSACGSAAARVRTRWLAPTGGRSPPTSGPGGCFTRGLLWLMQRRFAAQRSSGNQLGRGWARFGPGIDHSGPRAHVLPQTARYDPGRPTRPWLAPPPPPAT